MWMYLYFECNLISINWKWKFKTINQSIQFLFENAMTWAWLFITCFQFLSQFFSSFRRYSAPRRCHIFQFCNTVANALTASFSVQYNHAKWKTAELCRTRRKHLFDLFIFVSFINLLIYIWSQNENESVFCFILFGCLMISWGDFFQVIWFIGISIEFY